MDNASCHRDYLKFIRDTGNDLNEGLASIKKSVRSTVRNSDTIKHQLYEKRLASFRAKVSEPLPELSSRSRGNGQPPVQPSQFDELTRDHKVQEWEALRKDRENMSAQLLLQTIEEVEEFIDRLERIAHEVCDLQYIITLPQATQISHAKH